MVEKSSPKNITMPTENLDSLPAPELNINGIEPTIVENPVIIIGLNLFSHALIVDSKTLNPSFLF